MLMAKYGNRWFICITGRSSRKNTNTVKTMHKKRIPISAAIKMYFRAEFFFRVAYRFNSNHLSISKFFAIQSPGFWFIVPYFFHNVKKIDKKPRKRRIEHNASVKNRKINFIGWFWKNQLLFVGGYGIIDRILGRNARILIWKTRKRRIWNMDSQTTLWYRSPATDFDHALPVGNGRIGGMLFGDPEHEIIKLNEDSVW